MNESIHQRPRTMTVICKSCENQYGAWRPQCPACGTDTPAPPKSFNAPRKRQIVVGKSACVFCRQRKAKDRCPHCNELIHRTCQPMHDPACLVFQQQRDAAIKRLEGA